MLGVPWLTVPLAEEHTDLASGDLTIIFTDGLEMDIAGVTEVALSCKESGVETIANAVFDKALARKQQAFDDDATVLVLKVK
jgi:Stage II sporulation protein E (SpoIIE)